MQERKYGHVRTYGQGLERLLAHTYMAGSERRNNIVIVFMGRQQMRRVHREATERVGANQLGRNMRWKQGLVSVSKPADLG